MVWQFQALQVSSARHNAANDIYIPTPIRTLALLRLAPTSGPLAAPATVSFFPSSPKPEIELDRKEAAQQRYSSLVQDQGAKVRSRLLHSSTPISITQPTQLLPFDNNTIPERALFAKND
jgi:hypothetical protein